MTRPKKDEYAVGKVKNEIFIKNFYTRNILRKDGPWLTLDAKKYDKLRDTFDTIIFHNQDTGESFLMYADVFDSLRIEYNLGHGRSYKVLQNKFEKIMKGI